MLEGADERRFGAKIVEEVLAEHELAVANVGRAEQEDVSAGTAHEPGRLGVEEHDVLPVRWRRALEPEMHDDAWTPTKALKEHVQAGELGMKSGRGFLEHTKK